MSFFRSFLYFVIGLLLAFVIGLSTANADNLPKVCVTVTAGQCSFWADLNNIPLDMFSNSVKTAISSNSSNTTIEMTLPKITHQNMLLLASKIVGLFAFAFGAGLLVRVLLRTDSGRR